MYLNGRMLDGEVDGEVAWTLVGIQGWNDRLAVDHTTGRHHNQESPLQNERSISTMYNIVIGCKIYIHVECQMSVHRKNSTDVGTHNSIKQK